MLTSPKRPKQTACLSEVDTLGTPAADGQIYVTIKPIKGVAFVVITFRLHYVDNKIYIYRLTSGHEIYLLQ